MKKKTRTFKKGETISNAYKFAVEAIEIVLEETVKPEEKISSMVRITVEVVTKAKTHFEDTVAFDKTISDLGFLHVKTRRAIYKFVKYRREELKKPIRSTKALRRILVKFKAPGISLENAVRESMAQGWTGLFLRETDKTSSRSIKTEGGSDGGEW